jgi:hypothetical protein
VPDPRDPTPVRAVQRGGRWVVVDADGRRLPGLEPTDDEAEARAEAHRVNQTWRSARRERSSKGLKEGRLERALAGLEEAFWNQLLHPRLPKRRRGGGQFMERPEVAAQQRELERDVQRGITDKERMANRVRWEAPPRQGRSTPPTEGRRPRSIGSAGLPEGYLDKYQHPRVLPGEFHGAESRPLGPMRPEELRYSVHHALVNVEYLEARADAAERDGRGGEAAELRRLAQRWRERADELRGVEPIGSGEDPFGRPDPLTHPEFWTE